jgi:hypothetical protein
VTGNSVFTPRIEALVETALVRPSDKHNQLALVGIPGSDAFSIRTFVGHSHYGYPFYPVALFE